MVTNFDPGHQRSTGREKEPPFWRRERVVAVVETLGVGEERAAPGFCPSGAYRGPGCTPGADSRPRDLRTDPAPYRPPGGCHTSNGELRTSLGVPL